MKRPHMPGAVFLIVLLAGMLFLAFLYDPPGEIIPGTEGTYYGKVEDLAMASIAEERWEWEFDWRNKREQRDYISAGGQCFWALKGYDEGFDCSVGDYVEIEYGIEQGTELPVATKITVVKEKEVR